MYLYTEKVSSPRNLITRVKTKGRERVERKLSRRCREELGHSGSSAGAGRDTCSIIGRFINIDETKKTKSMKEVVHDSLRATNGGDLRYRKQDVSFLEIFL